MCRRFPFLKLTSLVCFLLIACTEFSSAATPQQSSSPTQEQTDSKQTITPASVTVLQNDSFAPLKITLQPEVEISALPSWATTPVKINKETDSLEIPLPPLSKQSDIEAFALTVNFHDMGDGGPLVEWVKHSGERILICSGLGINGPAIGLNSRTIAIPYELALGGGTVTISHTGRFEQIISARIRPARAAMVSALGGKITPTIVDESLAVLERESASGDELPFKKGDISHGLIMTAELSAPIQRITGELEFAFDLKDHPEATIFRTDVQGLDLESHIEVELNGTPVGTLNMAPFQLDAPELVATTTYDSKMPHFQLAGWQAAQLYLPAYLWKEKDNNLLLIIKEGAHSSDSTVHLKNSVLDMLPTAASTPIPQANTPPSLKSLFRP